MKDEMREVVKARKNSIMIDAMEKSPMIRV